MIDVEPTAQAIDAAAERMCQAAEKLVRIAKNMRSRNDINYASEALMEILNAVQGSRIDLLVVRPIRAYEFWVEALKADLKNEDNN